jgi:aryl-phospho-beta-D-glucosidase BglC (GH1 family)
MKYHVLAICAALFLIAGPVQATGALLSAGPLFTKGNQIVDGAGNPQRLACVGWNGGNSITPKLAGLGQVTYQATVSDMVRLGFNCVRVLTFARGVLDNTGGYLNTLDNVIDYAGVIGLRVIVDIHNDEGGHGTEDNWGTAPVNGLWYDKGGASDGTDGGKNIGTISDADFQQAWVNLATRWKDKPAILGYDLINEPHAGLTTWGGYSGAAESNTDIRAMHIRVGNAIHAIDPKPLIVAEGVQNYPAKAYEGDLRGVTGWPVTLNIPNKVVYSVHVYPQEVSDVQGGYGPSWIDRMNSTWGFIVKQEIAPVFVGECGDWLTTADSQAWAAAFVSYVNGTAPGGPTFGAGQQGISWSWWDWGVDESGGPVPNFGVLTAWTGGSLRPPQAIFLSQLFFYPSSKYQLPPRTHIVPSQPQEPPARPRR